ncbi:MAG: hypothetical protein NZ890_20350 [Myxococcota bacterium]|nr:hypothetical protein [Myxococcota bacterium]
MSPSEYAQALGERLLVLPEPTMRRQVLREALAQLGDEEAVALLRELCRLGRSTPGAEVALLALTAVLDNEDLGYERQAALYDMARRTGDDVVARMLLCGGRQPGTSRPLEVPPEEPSRPLGWRKSHARSPRREVIERLLHDPDPTVLEILLQNPRVVERDAVQLAARRPTSPEAQRVVFASRFSSRYAVRLALVMNPYTPVELSTRILSGLLHADIAAVTQRLDLAESLRETAALLLRERQAMPSDP